MAILMIACSKNTKETEIAVTSVSLSQPTAEMVIGETITLDATVFPSNASDKSVKWASSKISVATVSNGGQVTALAEGSTTITASAGGKSASCQVTVSKNYVEVTSVSINKTELALKKGQSETLVATVKPDDASDKTVIWSSADTAVATVDGEGKVTAVAGGETTITAKAGNQQATCVVTVTVPVESISLDRESITLEEGGLVTLVATIKPDDASEKKTTWSSTDTQIVTVDNNGNVTALKEGSATVIAEAEGKKAECVVTVQKKNIAVTSISINKSELQLEKGQTETLIATVKPDDATDKTVVWSSSDSGVATVDNDGKVAAIGGGNAIITAKAGNLSSTCAVTVIVPVESITLDQASITLVEGESITLSAVVKPDDATDKTIIWSSSDSSIASVEKGTVTAQKEGEAIIMAKHGTKEARCQVKVEHDFASDAIVFADENIKQKLVAAFDTNGDGELSIGEAAAVSSGKSIMNAFGSDKTGKSFDEFQYFIGITSVPGEMFRGWASLQTITLPVTVLSVGRYAFAECASLSHVSLPPFLMAISDGMFYHCEKIQSIVIPEGVTAIGVLAFSGCIRLSSINIPSSVTKIGGSAFWECEQLNEMYIDDLTKWLNVERENDLSHPFISSKSGKLFVKGEELSTIVVPNGVTTNISSAFIGCSNVSSVVIKSGIAEIGEKAFSNCSGLKTLIIEPGITAIGKRAFFDCSGLTSVIIPEGVMTIRQSAFYNAGLQTVVLPSTIDFIDGGAFYHDYPNYTLATVIIRAINPPYLASTALRPSQEIFVPAESVEAYKSADGWSKYADKIHAIQE